MAVEAIVFAKVVSPFVRGLEEGLVGDLQTSIEDRGVKVGRGLAAWIRRKLGKRDHRATDAQELGDRLDHCVVAKPTSAPVVAETVLEQGAADKLSVLDGLLTAVFTAARELKKPVVLSGFVTGSDHLMVVDVRTQVFGELYRAPTFAPHGQEQIPTVTLALVGASLFEQKPPPPRVWLITDPGPDDLASLTQAAKDAGPVFLRTDEFTRLMANRPMVTAITAQEVRLANSMIAGQVFLLGGPPLPSLPWDESSTWVVPMFEALDRLVESETEFAANFSAALRAANAPPDGPDET